MAAELFRRARAEMGMPMERLAEALHYEVRRVHLPEGIRGCSSRRSLIIFVSPSGYAPRDEFTVAHELLELHLPRSLRDLAPAEKERVCNRGAAALLLPREPFLSSLRYSAWSLPDLRQRWPWASWGVIAARIADLVPGVAACTWLGEKRESWHLGEGVSIPAIVSAESDAARLAHAGRARVVVRCGPVTARAWRLTAPRGRQVALTVTQLG